MYRRENSEERPRTGNGPPRLTLNNASPTWCDLVPALKAERVEAELDPVSRDQMLRVREAGLEVLESNPGMRAYGWDQALGSFKDRRLELEEQLRFQINVLCPHGTGLDEELPCRMLRLALIIRANCLARDTSGACPELVEWVSDAVNLGPVPMMPDTDSMGTGDLQPMVAAGLTLTGDAAGRVRGNDGEERCAPQAWMAMGRDVEFQPAPGEAIALISGSAVLTAHLALAVEKVYRQVETPLGASALFCEAARVERNAFNPRIHIEHHMSWEVQVNDLTLWLIGNSQWTTNEGRRRTGETAPRIQDLISIWSVPRQIDIIPWELERAWKDATREANSSTCNPLLIPNYTGEGHEFLSGGNWNAMVLGYTARSVNSRLARLMVPAKDLAARLLRDGWNHGLPAGLSGGGAGINSGILLLHTSATALIPEIQLLTNPVGALSSPLKGGQEDFRTMVMVTVNGLRTNSRRFDQLLAVLFVINRQGIHLLEERMRGLSLGMGPALIHEQLRARVTPLDQDRVLTPEVGALTDAIGRGEFSVVVHDLLED